MASWRSTSGAMKASVPPPTRPDPLAELADSPKSASLGVSAASSTTFADLRSKLEWVWSRVRDRKWSVESAREGRRDVGGGGGALADGRRLRVDEGDARGDARAEAHTLEPAQARERGHIQQVLQTAGAKLH